jgi:uncharacterized cupredoxin-like copper-binding protein
MNVPLKRPIVVVLGASLLLLAACSPSSSESPSASGGGGEGGSTVEVTLQEFAVIVAETSAPAGSITFSVTNDGPDDVHEFVIVQTDLEPGDLPTDEHGAVDESGEGVTVIDEIEDLPVGETGEVTVDLEAGNYVLICNIYSADENEAHYAEGMRTAFTVE